MNVLYVEFNFHGHRLKYINAFNRLEGKGYNLYYLVPAEGASFPPERTIAMNSGFNKKRSLKSYFAFVGEIKRAVKKYKIDVVHILDGDFLYRYFGLALKGIRAELIVTYHHMEFSSLKKISLRRIFKASAFGIVHTAKLKDELEEAEIKNAAYIDYPMFDVVSQKSSEEAKKQFGLEGNSPVLAAVGYLINYKGLDLLIGALNLVEEPCALFVAGEPFDYDEKYIRENLKNPLVSLTMSLRSLSDKEFADAIMAGDVIMLPYRRSFDGASGPLVSAVAHKKPVIGADHGSLGDMIEKYSLGATFKSEDVPSLAAVINDYLKNPFSFSPKAEEFLNRLNPADFVEKNADLYKKSLKSD